MYNKIYLKCFLSLFVFFLSISLLKIPPFLSAAALEYVNERRLDGKNCQFFNCLRLVSHCSGKICHSAFKHIIFNPIFLRLSSEMSAVAERSTGFNFCMALS